MGEVEVREERLITGSEAIAEAVRAADVDLVAAYPIRPYTGVMNAIANMIADGEFDAEYIVADSEHSQFEIAKHASSVGARVFTGSSGVGLMYAFEVVTVTPGDRLPVVAMVGNRALDDPGAFGVEHNDMLAARDLGWLMCWPESPQEALDMTLMAYRISEDPKVLLPSAVNVDGSFITHVRHPVNIPLRDEVEEFLPPYTLENRLHPDRPLTIAPQVDQDWLMEIRKQNDEAAKRAKAVTESAHKEFERVFGRGGDPYLEEYVTEGADVALIGMGSLATSLKATVRKLEEKGRKIGFIKLKRFRPFPTERLQKTLSRFKAVGVIDRDFCYGSPHGGGVLFQEIRSALYTLPERPLVVGFTAGLGGREVTIDNASQMATITKKAAETGKLEEESYWIGVRGL